MIRSARGQAIIELTLIMPLLLLLVLGVIEFSNMVDSYLVLTHLTREGANMSSRGTPASDALDAVIDSSCPQISDGSGCSPTNADHWRIIYTRMGPDSDEPDPKPYVVLEQIVRGSGEIVASSRICDGCGLTATYSCDPTMQSCSSPNVPNIADIGAGQELHAIEVFYEYQPVTPVGNFIGLSLGSSPFYERAIF
jgi:hypothetical protein